VYKTSLFFVLFDNMEIYYIAPGIRLNIFSTDNDALLDLVGATIANSMNTQLWRQCRSPGKWSDGKNTAIFTMGDEQLHVWQSSAYRCIHPRKTFADLGYTDNDMSYALLGDSLRLIECGRAYSRLRGSMRCPLSSPVIGTKKKYKIHYSGGSQHEVPTEKFDSPSEATWRILEYLKFKNLWELGFQLTTKSNPKLTRVEDGKVFNFKKPSAVRGGFHFVSEDGDSLSSPTIGCSVHRVFFLCINDLVDHCNIGPRKFEIAMQDPSELFSIRCPEFGLGYRVVEE